MKDFCRNITFGFIYQFFLLASEKSPCPEVDLWTAKATSAEALH